MYPNLKTKFTQATLFFSFCRGDPFDFRDDRKDWTVIINSAAVLRVRWKMVFEMEIERKNTRTMLSCRGGGCINQTDTSRHPRKSQIALTAARLLSQTGESAFRGARRFVRRVCKPRTRSFVASVRKTVSPSRVTLFRGRGFNVRDSRDAKAYCVKLWHFRRISSLTSSIVSFCQSNKRLVCVTEPREIKHRDPSHSLIDCSENKGVTSGSYDRSRSESTLIVTDR